MIYTIKVLVLFIVCVSTLNISNASTKTPDEMCQDEISAEINKQRETASQNTRMPMHMIRRYSEHLKRTFKEKKIGSCK